MTVRRHRSLAVALLPCILLAACSGRSKPAAPPPFAPAPQAPPTTDVAPTPSPVLGDATASPLDGDLAAAMEHAYRTGLLADVHFDFDQATLDPASRERLAANARFFTDRPEFVVQIEGHCDERGTNDYNLALGERRAQGVRDYLISLGVAASRLRTISLGEERPACTDSTESCWARNRRAHFVLVDRVGRG